MPNEHTTPSIAISIPEADALPPSMLMNIHAGFDSAFRQAEELREKALAIRVTSLAQRPEMKLAREMRLELRDIRVTGEKTKKKLKEDSLRLGRAIDGVFNLLLAAVVPLEKHLEEQEKFGERLAELERQKLLADRTEAIRPFIADGQMLPPLADMTDDQFKTYLADAKLLHGTKVEAAKKAEIERLAREQAERAELERTRQENERLRQEAAAREAQAKAEREAAAKAHAEELAAAAEAKRIADEAARKEREKIEAQAKAEQAARIAAESQVAELRAADAAKAAAEAEAMKRAARAPDKAKLHALAETIRSIPLPQFSTEEGRAFGAVFSEQSHKFATWIENQAAKL